VFSASLVMADRARPSFVGMGSSLEEASFDLGGGPDRHLPPGDAATAADRP
jgi:hypothetical protein